MAPARTNGVAPASNWTTEYDTRRRHQLFRQPPRDKTAYPTLAEATKPHVDS
ncbi:hypothetical protein KC324_g21237, partial [Hortaea werneckii]